MSVLQGSDGWWRQGMSRPAALLVRIPKDGGREWPFLQRLGFESWEVTAGNVPSCRTFGSNSAIRRSGRPYLCAEAPQPHIAFSGRPALSCPSRRFGLGVLGLVPATLANLDSVL